MSQSINWFDFEGKEQIATPALLVYPNRIKKNILKMLAMAGNAKKLMPHVKTHKMEAVVKLQLEVGIEQFKCATIAEVEMCAQAGAKTVLLAYPLSAANCQRFLQLTQKFPKTELIAIVDNMEFAIHLGSLFQKNNLIASVLIDINVGMNRTGVCINEAAKLFTELKTSKGIRCKGFHAYDGHIHDSDRDLRFQNAKVAITPVLDLQKELERESNQELLLVAGGSGTFPYFARLENIFCSPGTPLFWDTGYSQLFPDLSFEIAALLLATVISQPTQNTYCLDVGYKAVAAENPLPIVVFPEFPDAKVLFQSEEHLVIESDEPLQVGDAVFVSPIHICPSVALYDEAYTIEDGKLSGSWEVTARKRKITV